MAASITVKDFRLYRYRRLLHNGCYRCGLILKVTDRSGNTGWGEIAPLPGFSREHLAAATAELQQKIVPLIAAKTVLADELNHTLLSCYPSVQFGVEAAWLDLICPCAAPSIPVSGLIQGSKKALQTKLQHCCYSTIKLKLTALALQEAHAVIDAALSSLTQTKIRIDANQSWTLSEALSIAAKIPLSQLDYYEEPLRHFTASYSFPYPTAYDETARQQPLDRLIANPYLKAIVVKPTLSGGLTQLSPIAAFCRKKSIDFILSSSYESELGLMQIAKLCNYLQLPPRPMGLDTYRYFQTPLLSPPITVQAGQLVTPRQWRINEELVDECFRMSL
ncbi:MAG: o-succinylbenzoate synthase [Chlamydiota bacterium]